MGTGKKEFNANFIYGPFQKSTKYNTNLKLQFDLLMHKISKNMPLIKSAL